MTDLLRAGGFRRLLAAQAVSDLGNWATNVALILLLVRLLDQPAVAAALVLLTKLGPRLIISPIGGVLADRYDRRRMMIVADLARAILSASLLLVTDVDHLWWALAATALAQVMTGLFNPAAAAAVPALVPTERLAPANALRGSVDEIAFFVGPMLGALAVAVGGLPLAFFLDAMSFLISAALLVGLGDLRRQATVRPPLTMRRDLTEAWSIIRGDRVLATLFGSQAIFGALIAAVNVLLVPLLVLQWSAPEAYLGLLYAAVAGGCLIGAAWAARLTPPLYLRVTLWSVGGIGAATLALGVVPSVWLGLAMLVVIGIMNMAGDVASIGAIQSKVTEGRLGGIFGLLFWVIAIGQAAGAGLVWLASPWPPVLLIAALGLVTLLTAPVLASRFRPAAGATGGEFTELTRPS